MYNKHAVKLMAEGFRADDLCILTAFDKFLKSFICDNRWCFNLIGFLKIAHCSSKPIQLILWHVFVLMLL